MSDPSIRKSQIEALSAKADIDPKEDWFGGFDEEILGKLGDKASELDADSAGDAVTNNTKATASSDEDSIEEIEMKEPADEDFGENLPFPTEDEVPVIEMTGRPDPIKEPEVEEEEPPWAVHAKPDRMPKPRQKSIAEKIEEMYDTDDGSDQADPVELKSAEFDFDEPSPTATNRPQKSRIESDHDGSPFADFFHGLLGGGVGGVANPVPPGGGASGGSDPLIRELNKRLRDLTDQVEDLVEQGRKADRRRSVTPIQATQVGRPMR